MDFSFATFAALFALFTAALCAPVELQGAWGDARSSSLELNSIAMTTSLKARNASTGVGNFNISLAWMGAHDMCDPWALKQKSTPCIGKIFNLLRSYIVLVEQVSGFQTCKFAEDVKPALNKLHDDISKRVESVGDWKQEEVPVPYWLEAPLCQYTMDRLFSFSIFTARVFAAVDQARLTEGSAQKCM